MTTPDAGAAVRRITRTFLVCHGLRWLPAGFVLPILVLVPTARGLDLPTVGLMFAAYGATTALLELPTGGLADTIGRRPVLLVATVADAGLLVALAIGTRPWHFVAGALVGGMGRALLSGPLESWYVDAVRAVDPGIALRPGLGAAGLVEGIALASGALLSAVLPTVGAGLPVDGPVSQLTLPLYGGMGAEALSFGAVLGLLREPRSRRSLGRPAPRGVVTAITDSVRLAGASRDLRLLCASFLLVAVAFVGVEVLWQPRFAVLLGGADRASQTFGYLVVGMSLGASVGAGAAGRLPASVRRPGVPAAVVGVATAVALGGLAVADAFAVAAPAYVVLYSVGATQQVLLAELLHDRVPADRRATMVSVQSLCMQTGNVIAGLTLTRVAAAAGIPTAWTVGAVLLLVPSGLLALVARATRVAVTTPRSDDGPLLRSVPAELSQPRL